MDGAAIFIKVGNKKGRFILFGGAAHFVFWGSLEDSLRSTITREQVARIGQDDGVDTVVGAVEWLPPTRKR